MDFLDFAKEIETQGIERYSLLAKTMQVKGLSGIFTYMADQEKLHFELFDSWQRNRQGGTPELPVETVLGKAKDVFEHLAGHFLPGNFVAPSNYEQAYMQALEFENKSLALYEETLPKIDDENQLSMLKLIIDQEKAHARYITVLMEFLRHPGEWLENAEWLHLEDF
jgi:rubrerythrin